MSAVLWKFVRVFSPDQPAQELLGPARDSVAQHLATIHRFSSRTVTSKEQADVERDAREAFSKIEKLIFKDARDAANPVDMHWIDVVFTLRRELDKDDYIRMNLPVEFWGEKSKVPEEVREPLRKYFSDYQGLMRDGIGLYLSGPTGRGKSTAAAALAKAIRSLSRTVFFVTVADLREMVRSKIEFGDDQLAMDRCKQVDFLVLDNLRSTDAKEMFVGATALEDLLRHRVSSKKPTVITSQMSLGELSKALPGFCEIAESACVVLKLTGPDLRGDPQVNLQKRLGLGTPKS